ncbi:MAG: MFS transporter [Sulfurifustis sp.]
MAAPKNVFLLAVCQATMMTGQSLMLAAAPFIGLTLAPTRAAATLPIGLQFAATLATTMPAAFVMKHIGRRAGFLIGAVLGIAGSLLAAYAIWAGNFVLFCAGLMLNGMFNGFGTYYRFAAADAAGPDYRAQAISYVLAGGVVAALLGPNLARLTAGILPTTPFTGSYLALVAVYIVTLITLLFVDIPAPTAAERAASGGPLAALVRRPAFAVAVLGGMIAFAVMNLIMTSTPLAMHDAHYAFGDAAFIIQWHMLGMFAPSFVSGRLIARYGTLPIMQCGAALLALCAGIDIASQALWAIWLALVLLGIGWNFLFVGATTLLTGTYAPEEKAKAQALNDFLILGTTTATAFFAAPLHYHFGWSVINAAVIPLIVGVAAAVLWLQRRNAAVPAATTVG